MLCALTARTVLVYLNSLCLHSGQNGSNSWEGGRERGKENEEELDPGVMSKQKKVWIRIPYRQNMIDTTVIEGLWSELYHISATEVFDLWSGSG